jgi:DNA-binding transcriptional LysR family regulator
MTAVESSAVRLGGFPTAPMSGIASRLRDHGEIEQVSIEVEWATSVLLQQLESGRLDFALLREFPGFELRLPTGVDARTIVESESAYVVMAADHPPAIASRHRGEIDLADLAGEEWIGEPPDDSGFHVLFRAACEQAGFTPRIEHHSVDTSVVMGFVTSGQGVALISPTSYRMLSSDVTTRPLAGDPIHRRLLLAWSTESPRAQMASDVCEMASRAYDEAFAEHARWGQHQRMQNSLPSGSASTTQDASPWPMSTRRAPWAISRATSASWSSGLKSRCRRLLDCFASSSRTKSRPGI